MKSLIELPTDAAVNSNIFSIRFPYGRADLHRVRTDLQAVQWSLSLSGLPVPGLVFLREAQAGEVSDLLGLQNRGWSIERALDWRTY
jgi:hypothetical protein